jgi:hypothetical protein
MNERIRIARVSLYYQITNQVYKWPKLSIYREGARATHPLLPFFISWALEAHG